MNKHTPGPWLCSEAFVYALTDLDCRPVNRFFACVSSAQQEHEAQRDELVANARLIASAPELLEQLMQANAQMELALGCVIAKRYDEAELHLSSMARPRRDAIAKATGND